MHWIDWCIVVIPVLAVFSFAIYSKKYVRGVVDYLAAGRVAGRYVITVGDMTAGLGIITLVALVEANYQTGIAVSFWNIITTPVGILVGLTGFCIYRFRKSKALSNGQFLEMRYSRSFRIIASSIRLIAEMLCNSIGPAVAANFFIYFFGLPHKVMLWGYSIPTFAFNKNINHNHRRFKMKFLKSMFFATAISLCATAFADECMDWTFNKESGMQNWKVGSASAIKIQADGLKMLSGRDCKLMVVGLKVQADDLSVLKITMKANKNGMGQVFFGKPGSGLNEKASVRFKVKSGEHVYIINCASNKLWNGTINVLRVDPTNIKDVEILIKSIKLLPPLNSWTFNAINELSGWKPNAHMKKIKYNEEGVSFTSGRDSYMTSPSLNIKAEKFTKLEVVMKNSADDLAQLFFITSGKVFSAKLRVKFPVKASSEWKTYTIDCAADKNWVGVIKRLRFDPVCNAGNKVEIKSLNLLP